VSLRIALNQKYIPQETELKDRDEVAFIPPVQGG
jgi:molybdopterin converting factor small subunit